MNQQEKKQQQQEYNEYVKQVTPTRNLAWAMCRAFLVGGSICTIGQVILNAAASMGLDKQKPRLMWNCEGGKKQTAYRIVTDNWDSGKVEGNSGAIEGGEPVSPYNYL